MRGLSALRAWLAGDPPDRDRLTQLRDLWRVSSDWTIPQSAKVIPTRRKVKTLTDWYRTHGERKAS